METEARGEVDSEYKAWFLAHGLVAPKPGLESGVKEPAASEPGSLDLNGR